MDDKTSTYITRLEELQFCLEKSNDKQPSLQADAIRNVYLHLTEGKSNSKICEERNVWQPECEKMHERYANVVDNMDDSGLNNFAAGALSLCHYYKNESSKWQTSLSADRIVSLLNLGEYKDQRDKEEDSGKLTIPIITRKQGLNSTSVKPLSSHQPSPSLLGSDRGVKPNNQSSMPYLSKSVDYNKPSLINNHPQNTPSFKQNNYNWNYGQPNTNPYKQPSSCSTFDSRGFTKVDYCSQKPFKQEKESINVSASKVGGPYANFGQKPKKGQNPTWKSTNGKSHFAEEEEGDVEKPLPFKTAREQLVINQMKKFGGANRGEQVTGANYGSVKRSLGTRRGPSNKFVPPVIGQDIDEGESSLTRSILKKDQRPLGSVATGEEELVDERLKGIDPNMIELIKNDIMDTGSQITWSDIAGLEFAKKTIQEIVVWPMLRPDIFTGLRGPPKGLLLFGPPGTGKTLIGKCIASQSKSTFFCISASSLTSKWVGEGEKMVRALFAVARCSQPAVVFIDEVDSLLSQRSDSEHESSRRIKTEFLVQLDGASTASDERLLVIGATNRPQEIDEAARRRFVKRLLIPLPEAIAREQIVLNLTAQQRCNLGESDLKLICDKTDGYSGADMSNLCREAALGPIRSIPFELMETITPDQVRPMQLEDFEQALLQVRASVSKKDLELYQDWNKTYGSFGR